MAYCELLKQNCLSLLEMQDWLIESNLAIILTNCNIKRESKLLPSLCLINLYSNII